MNDNIKRPSSILIETVALNLATTFYEVGRGQGLTSKHKTHKAYAKANLHKFIPKAVEYCLDMLHNPHTSAESKQLIFEALQERVNDNTIVLPDIDIKTILPKQEPKPVIINTEKKAFDINKVALPMKV